MWEGLPRILIASVMWVDCTACVLVCMLFRLSQEVLIVINIGNSLMQDNVEEGIANKIKEVPHKILETIS